LPEASHEVTLLLARAGQGDPDATSRLLEIVYAELRGLAGAYARGQRSDHTLQPTALVNEAFLKLVHGDEPAWNEEIEREWASALHLVSAAMLAGVA